VLDLEEIDDRLDLLPVLESSFGAVPEPRYRACSRTLQPHLEIATGHEVVEHAHAAEERDVLEGPGDASFAASYGSALRRLRPLNATLPAAGVHAVDDVEL